MTSLIGGSAAASVALSAATLSAATLSAVAMSAVALAADTAPAAGRYAATLCVRTAAAAPPSCGPAEVELRGGGMVRVQVSDIVYWLQMRPARSAVVITQGSMQLDEFDTAAQWHDGVLRFADEDKDARYEVRIGTPTRR